MIFPWFANHNFAVRLRDKVKEQFISTEHFEVARNSFGRTCWNNTQVRLLGQE
jgi:hypothetical protein